jgi:hypothetical protein
MAGMPPVFYSIGDTLSLFGAATEATALGIPLWNIGPRSASAFEQMRSALQVGFPQVTIANGPQQPGGNIINTTC